MALMMHDAFSLRGLAAGCALLFLVAPAVQAAEQLPDAPSIDARAWILMDYASGKVLSEGNADEKLDPASLTKIMTSYVVGQAIKAGKIKLTDMVTVGRDAWATGNPALRGSSVMFLKPGMQVSVEDLNKGVIIQSGNDASIAIADYVAGSQDAFVSLMNGYAKKMGLTNTTFMTVHGLDAPGQFSTARDMALLTKALIHDVPEEYAVHKEKEFTFNKIRQPNRNRLLWSSNLNADGVKTGTTAGAGYNLVSSATQGDMRLIAVVLGTKTDRMVENALLEIPTGLIEASRAMGATPLQIVRKVLLPEALPGLVNAATITLITLVGYSAMGGAVGAGGLGQIGYQYGYIGYNATVMNTVLVLLVVLVYLIQFSGDRIVRAVTHK